MDQSIYYIRFHEHFKFISICVDVLKMSVLKQRYNYAKGYMEIEFLRPPFCFNKDKAISY